VRGGLAARAVQAERRDVARRLLGAETGWHRPGSADWRMTAGEAHHVALLAEQRGWRAEGIALAQGIGLCEIRDLTVRHHPLAAVLRLLEGAGAWLDAHPERRAPGPGRRATA
jgi:hypothetical protein